MALRRKGLADTPNITLLNVMVVTSGESLLVLSTHRNHNTSLSVSVTEIIRKPFQCSLLTLSVELRIRGESQECLGKRKVQYTDSCLEMDWQTADASNTSLILVVSLSLLTTA